MYKVGIIGYGSIGKLRARLVTEHPEMELDSICDVIDYSEEKTYTCPYFTEYRQVLDRKPDIIFVCTTNDLLAEVTIASLRNGCHVFSEKPPGRTKSETQAMIDTASQHPELKLKFGFNHRYHESVIQAYKLAKSGRLGKILSVRGVYGKSGAQDYEDQWRNRHLVSGGGILLDQGIHLLDLMLLFCNSFTEVKAYVDNLYWNIDVEDNVFALLRNDQKQTGILVSSAIQWKHTFTLEIILEQGYLSLKGILSNSMSYGRESLTVARKSYEPEKIGNPEEQTYYFDQDNSWNKEIDEFVSCVKNNTPIEVGTAHDALRAIDLVYRIYQSDKTWQTKSVEVI